MRSFTLIAASALVAFASAQTSTSVSPVASTSTTAVPTSITTVTAASTTSDVLSGTQSQSMPPSATAGFNPNNVTDSLRTDWCRAQRNSCRSVCGGGPQRNDCTESTLTYSCTCFNGSVPDLTRYTETLPYYICIATRDQCIAAHPDDLAGQETCMNTAQCGTITPPEIAPENSATTTAGGSGSSSGSPSATSATTTTTSNAAVVYNAEMTTGAFAAVLMVLLKFLL